MRGDDPYIYPGSRVLINKFGITDAARLAYFERELVVQRAAEGIPSGQFDLPHLQNIHRHLFQDVYEWAGQLRTVEISKAGHPFQLRRFIETGMADVFRRLLNRGFLSGLSTYAFAKEAAEIIGDVNYVHPFRDGNGRAQLFYLEQLAANAGHRLELARLDPAGWIEASRAAHHADYSLMATQIGRCLDF
jgi:cell filamentation protein